MTVALEDGAGGAARLGGEPLEGRGRAGHRALDAQILRFQAGIVLFVGLEILRVGEGGGQSLGHHPRALARDDGQNRLGAGGRQALNLPHDFAHFLGRHPHVFGDRMNFHNQIYLASALAVCAPCFLKVRVRENSPRRWPTMFSVTNTGWKILPLCTAKFSPTKSGVIMERRDQVLMGDSDLAALASSILTIKCPSMNGPFLIDLPIK